MSKCGKDQILAPIKDSNVQQVLLQLNRNHGISTGERDDQGKQTIAQFHNRKGEAAKRE